MSDIKTTRVGSLRVVTFELDPIQQIAGTQRFLRYGTECRDRDGNRFDGTDRMLTANWEAAERSHANVVAEMQRRRAFWSGAARQVKRALLGR